MSQQEIQTLAQSLIDLEIEKRRIEDEMSLIKLDLWRNAIGGIKCNGGTVFWVEAGEEMRFNKDKLKEVLIEYGIDEDDIESMFDRSKIQTTREANIKIKLDR